METIRVGIVGLGENTRLRHVPGLRACPGVEITAVCNRTAESTARAAREHGIPQTFNDWRALVVDPGIDAVVIGTWPYLHAAITIAALEAGKHVLTEARMASSLDEARRMLEASRKMPQLVTQIVPSPVGLAVDRTVRRLIREGYLGELREVVVLATNDAYAGAEAPLHWRQKTKYSGRNMLTLGILHETLTRWVPQPVRVLAQTHVFTRERIDPETGRRGPVETPDAVQVLAEFPSGGRGVYHFSGAVHHGPGIQIHLYGSEGTLKLLTAPREHLVGARRGEPDVKEIPVPPEELGGWRVEAEFIGAIRGQEQVQFTDFVSGVQYMAFTEAVAESARTGSAVSVAGSV
jgi:predicted dehydrogenase